MKAPEPSRTRALRLGLAAFLGGMASLHLAMPKPFERMIPAWLPGDVVTWNLAATAAEGGSALLLSSRKTARAGGVAAAATFLTVWVANIQAAFDGGYPIKGPLGSKEVAWARVPLQVPMIWWALAVSRNARLIRSGRHDGEVGLTAAARPDGEVGLTAAARPDGEVGLTAAARPDGEVGLTAAARQDRT